MRRLIKTLILGLILSLGLLASPAHASPNTQRVLVKFRPLVPKILQDRLHSQLGARLTESLLADRTFVVRVPASREEIIAQNYQKSFWVEYAEPDGVVQALEIPNDPLFPDQWGQTKIKTPEAWDVTTGDSNVQIAILDTGITNSHDDLTSQVESWVNFSSAPTSFDQNGHGSHVAGIAAAITNNGLGAAGTGRQTHLQSVKVLGDNGSGYYSWVINGIYWAADNGAEVINMSLGGSSGSTSLKEAINYAWNKGVVLVAAAGNNGNSWPVYPAYYANNIAVAATDQNDNKANFSTYGSWVDVAAPGVAIVSTLPNNSYAFYNGTSMATPHVAGVAALIKAAFPGFSNQQVRNKLEETADKISGTGFYWTFGRVNAAAAVIEATPSPMPSPSPNPSPSPSPTPSPPSSPLPSPSPSASPSPEPANFTATITSHTVTTRWSNWLGGRVNFNLKFRIDSGQSGQVVIKEVTDGIGNWGLYQSRTRVDVYVNGVGYRTNMIWNDTEETATVELGALGLILKTGDVVKIRNLRLGNDTRGNHSSNGQVFDELKLISEKVVAFTL